LINNCGVIIKIPKLNRKKKHHKRKYFSRLFMNKIH